MTSDTVETTDSALTPEPAVATESNVATEPTIALGSAAESNVAEGSEVLSKVAAEPSDAGSLIPGPSGAGTCIPGYLGAEPFVDGSSNAGPSGAGTLIPEHLGAEHFVDGPSDAGPSRIGRDGDETNEAEDFDMYPKKRSLLIAYLLLLNPLGIFGLHHFYLKRTKWGLLYAFTVGACCIGWIFDIFRLPILVKRANKELAEGVDEFKHLDDAYVLWFPVFGLFGGYHFYLNRSVGGIKNILSLSGFGLLWIIDGFLMPCYVSQSNLRILERRRKTHLPDSRPRTSCPHLASSSSSFGCGTDDYNLSPSTTILGRTGCMGRNMPDQSMRSSASSLITTECHSDEDTICDDNIALLH